MLRIYWGGRKKEKNGFGVRIRVLFATRIDRYKFSRKGALDSIENVEERPSMEYSYCSLINWLR